jgi:hypothetical protein
MTAVTKTPQPLHAPFTAPICKDGAFPPQTSRERLASSRMQGAAPAEVTRGG